MALVKTSAILWPWRRFNHEFSPIPHAKGPIEQMREFVEDIFNESSSEEAKQAFYESLNFLKELFYHPTFSKELLISSFLEFLKGTESAVLDMLKHVFDPLIESAETLLTEFGSLVKTNLNSELKVLWDFMVENDKSEKRPFDPLGIACLLIAIPSTFIYKAAFDEAPFMEAGSLANENTDVDCMPRGYVIKNRKK